MSGPPHAPAGARSFPRDPVGATGLPWRPARASQGGRLPPVMLRMTPPEDFFEQMKPGGRKGHAPARRSSGEGSAPAAVPPAIALRCPAYGGPPMSCPRERPMSPIP